MFVGLQGSGKTTTCTKVSTLLCRKKSIVLFLLNNLSTSGEPNHDNFV